MIAGTVDGGLCAANYAAFKRGVARDPNFKALVPCINAGRLDNAAIGAVDLSLCDIKIGTRYGADGRATAHLLVMSLVVTCILQTLDIELVTARYAHSGC